MVNKIVIYSLLAAVFFSVLAFYLVKKRSSKFNFKKFYMVIAIAAITFFCFRNFWMNSYVFEFNWGIRYGEHFKKITQVMMVWLAVFNILIVAFNAFFDIKLLRNLNKFFVLPCLVYNIIFASVVAQGIVSPIAFEKFSAQLMFYGLELGMVFACSLILALNSIKEKITKKDLLHFALALIPMIISCMPSQAFRAFDGINGTMYNFRDFSVYHRIVLYLMFGIPTAIYFVLKNKDRQVVKFAMLFIAFSTLISFLKGSVSFIWQPTHWPLHLCHTAMFIVPLCLIFKMNRLFYFAYFINVLGALIAMVIPNYDGLMMWTSPSLLGFLINHFPAFFMPILMVALKFYERPAKKQFKYSIVAFSIYFAFILIINAWFSNYRLDVNYFYANTEFVAEQLGQWAINLRNIVLDFNIGNLYFKFYPVYQFLFYLVYIGFGLAMWFIYELGMQTADNIGNLINAKRKIKQDEFAFLSQLNGRMPTEPKKEGINMLKLINFSKRYGSSKEFAVKNANLEVKAGEIFGFLGPNGAGKSTIIKSIVGIQPPTSGVIEVCGFDVVRQDVEAKMQIGFVPDHYALYEKLTGREYINYMADIYKVSKEDRDKRIDRFVKMFELENAFDNQIKTYSHGMKQKITIIAALIHNPKLWILDEPLTGLDPTSIYQVKEAMKEYAKQGNIVFFSSHIIDVVERICDKIAIIKKGEVQCVMEITDLAKKVIKLEDFYLETIGQPNPASENVNIKNAGTEKEHVKSAEKKVKSAANAKAVKSANSEKSTKTKTKKGSK